MRSEESFAVEVDEVRGRVIDLASTLHHRFLDQPATERQELLKPLLANTTWEQYKLTVEFREPWKTLQNTRTTLATPNTLLAAATRESPAFVAAHRTLIDAPTPELTRLFEQVGDVVKAS